MSARATTHTHDTTMNDASDSDEPISDDRYEPVSEDHYNLKFIRPPTEIAHNTHSYRVAVEHSRRVSFTELKRDNKRIKIARESYVRIGISGCRRDDVSLGNVSYIAQIQRIAVPSLQFPVLELKWLYPKDDLLPSVNTPPINLFDNLVNSLGKNELLSRAQFTAAPTHNVEDTITVTEYDPHRLSLMVLTEDALYVRSNIILTPVWGSPDPVLISDSFRSICKFPCIYDGHYAPDDHYLRFCQTCNTWFHIDCLSRSDATSPSLLPDPDGEPLRCLDFALAHTPPPQMDWTTIRFPSSFDRYRWFKLTALPIQRGYPGYSFPLSFELLLDTVRSDYARNSTPHDLDAYLRINMPVLEESLYPRYINILTELISTPPIYYSCPKCTDPI